jgi:nucleotide-binding universal stress UspA family protein
MSHRTGAAPGRVVVGIHTGLSGLHALRLAVSQARALGVGLHAVRAWDTDCEPAGYLEGVPADHPAGRPMPAAQAAAIVDQAFAETMGGEPADVPVRTVLVPDRPGAALVEYACRDNDLLVIGAGGRGGHAAARWCATVCGTPRARCWWSHRRR